MKIYYIVIGALIAIILLIYYYRTENYSYYYPSAPGRVNPSLFFDKSLKIDHTYPNKIE